ncbi:MAG: hypothetical protein PHY93_14160 [Bacteriovorax sp.]|nr:hypothetical protein [Bacteriovorax sp.]
MAYVYVDGQRIDLSPSKAIGKGGEADIYDIGNSLALKLFKTPDHPDLVGQPNEQMSAQMRLEIHQTKLKEFPCGLPNKIIQPIKLAYFPKNHIAGYVMKLLRGAELITHYSEPSFGRTVAKDDVRDIFLDLHQTVSLSHQEKVVFGDFNDLNVLVKGTDAFVLDADSFQFGKYFCSTFTTKFIDPLNIRATTIQEKNDNLNIGSFIMYKPHSEMSDWYAFAVMLMQSFLFVDPYGGVFKPKNKMKMVNHSERPLHRITVFNPEVKYPKPAIHYSVLPDELLDLFQKMFERDYRTIFPRGILENMRWTVCSNCGGIHARGSCPFCKFAAPAAVKEVIVVRGQVTATTIFQTKGHILFAAFQNGKMNWLYHENNKYKREDGSVVISSPLDNTMRYRISNQKTIIGKGGQMVVLDGSQVVEKISVDTYGGLLPMFDANESNFYWSTLGSLKKDSPLAPEYIGETLADQTLFWVGSHFGFGFYRAGEVQIAFIFNTNGRGLNDNVKIPRIQGQLVDSTCVFAKERCWFFTSTKEKTRIINTCSVIKADGSIEATSQCEAGDGSWLSQIRGKCAVGNFLFTSTDDGLIRLEVKNGQIEAVREFPDTEPFVDANSNLFLGQLSGNGGVFVVNDKVIKFLQIK